jgi:D-alanine-D-alanine ligase
VKKRLRVLVLNHPDLAAPDVKKGSSKEEINVWKTEYDVVRALRGLGHEVQRLLIEDELQPIRTTVGEWKPDIVFNLLEEFRGMAEFDTHVVSYLELLGVPYTGCNPRGLMLARGKGLSKKIVGYHRVHAPRFAVFTRGRKVRRPRGLSYPLIVKSLTEEASLGISQASVVEDDEKLAERVAFIHQSIGTDAIAEQYIAGREFYVGVLGNRRTTVFPVWELTFEKMRPGTVAIATARVKHDVHYQKKAGIFHQPAEDLDERLVAHIQRTTRRIFRALQLDGYARIDYRLAESGELYFLEANPNPEIAREEEFASAADMAGFPYPQLLQRILNLGLRRGA